MNPTDAADSSRITGNSQLIPPKWSQQTIDPYRNCPEMRCGGCKLVSWTGQFR
jgi:hypothetical protein